MVTWGQISEWQDLPLLEAYARISMAEASIENNGEVLYRAELKFNSEGEAAESARRVIQELRQDVDLVEGQLSDFMIAIRCAAIEVEELAFRVRSVQITAASALLEINDVGEVSYSQTLWNMINVEFRNILEVTPEEWLHLVSQSDTSAWRRAAPVKVELEAEIQSLLARAHEIDERLGQACRAIVGGRVSDSVAVVSAGDVSGEAALDVLNELSGVPAEVRAFWDSLSVSLQESLIENFPEILGALNGIPFADRLRANRLNSLRRVRDLNDQIQDLDRQIDALKPGMSEREAFDLADLRSKRSELQQEVSYINSVLDDPGRGCVLFDPENNRLIEQNGSLSGVVDEVYTHVPGTGTSLASFIDESATAFPVALREEGSVQGVEVSTFTYMDGRYDTKGGWITWPGGGRANTNAEYLAEKGRELAEFECAVRLEDAARGADVNIGGHSAGQSPIFASEMSGAWYDQSSSFAGSYSPVEWKGNAATSYDHFYYAQEPLNLMKIGVAEHPYKSSLYEQHRFEHGGGVLGYLNGFGHHVRVNSGGVDNELVVLEQLRQMRLSGRG